MSVGDHQDIIKLASLVSEANDKDVPFHLVKLKGIIQQYQESPQELHDVKEVILEYDLLSWCATVLKYDYSKVSKGHAMAVDIIDVLSICCSSMDLRKYEEFKNSTLPDAINNILYHAFSILEQYHETSKQFGSIKYGVHAENIATYKVQYQSLLGSLMKLVTSQSHLAKDVLESDNLIRLLIEDSVEMEKMQIVVLELIQRCVRVNPGTIVKLSTQALNHLLDELIFKITTSQSDNLVGLTVKILLMLIDTYPELASKMTMRFKGLKALMTKWLGHGFDHNLKALLEILDAGNAKIAELTRRTHAVKVIWAAYHGWKTRTRVAKLHKVIPSLQSSFRKKRQEKLQVALKEKLGSEKKYETELERKRRLRSVREKQLHMLEIVPARHVNKHIQKEEEKAAVKIQSAWKGNAQRKQHETKKVLLKQTNAAIVIQRAMRKFLARRKKRPSGLDTLSKYSSIPKEVREEYLMKIEQNKVVRGKKEVSLAEAKDIHDQVQQRLLSYHASRCERIKYEDPRLDALLAKIHTEEEVLSNLPELSISTKSDVDNLSSGSKAVALAAEREHYKTMKELSSQWWQNLNSETCNSLDPFDEKIKPVYDQDIHDIEEFLKQTSNHASIFG